jgi:hypothetical protein
MNGKGLPAKRRIRYIKGRISKKSHEFDLENETKKLTSDWLLGLQVEVGKLWMAKHKTTERLDRLYLLYYGLTILTGLIILWVTLGGKV